MKRIISLLVSVCMLLTVLVAIPVSASTAVITGTQSEVVDNQFTVSFYTTDANMNSFSISYAYPTELTLVTTEDDVEICGGKGSAEYNDAVEGQLTFVWSHTKKIGTLVTEESGKYKIADVVFSINPITNDEVYETGLKLTRGSADNNYYYDDDDNEYGADYIAETVAIVVPDTRTEIEGLSATPVEGLKYTGTAFAAEDLVTLNTIAGDDVSYETVPADVVNAGTYKVTATVKRAGYKPTAVSTDVTIGKADTTITIADAEITYGDTEYIKDFTVLEGVNKAEITVTDYTVADLNAGEKEITATATSANYNVTVTPGTLTVNKAAYAGDPVVATKNVTTNKAKSYEVDMTSALSDILGAEVVSAAENADANEIISNVNVVGNKVTFDVASYATATPDIATIDVVIKSTNYENFTATLKISTVDKVELTISGVTVADKTYDGAAVVADKSGLTVEGATEPAFDNATLVYTYEGTGETVYSSTEEAPVNAGTYKLVISVPETNEDYVGAADVAFTIAKKDVTITVDNAEKYVDAADPEAFTGVTEGFVGTDADAIIYERVAGEEAGTYEITATFDNPNYNVVDNIPGVFTINRYNVEVKAPNVTVYVGKEIPALNATVTITDAIEGLAEEITTAVEVWDGESKVEDISTIDTSVEKTYTTKVVVTCNEGKFDVAAPIDGTLTVRKASGRPSGGGTVIKPAAGGGAGTTTKPEDDKKDEDKEDNKPAASANIALKEDAEEIKFIEGFEDKTFRPDVNATRNDVVAALTALFDITDVENAPEFEDTDDKAITDLAAAGVIDGYEDGSFKGYNDITRAEFVKLLAAALKLEAVEGAEANFSDIEGHWAAEWIKTFASKGYLVGYPDGTFRPEDKITRAEMVVVITRVVGTVDAEIATTFADVDDAHWAYDYIKNAAK